VRVVLKIFRTHSSDSRRGTKFGFERDPLDR
jgi:hypothetical protein